MVVSVTMEEVRRHTRQGDSWVVVDGIVLDVSSFAKVHPGGEYLLQKHSGEDVSQEFHLYHRKAVLDKYRPRLQVATMKGYVAHEETIVPYGDPIWASRFNSPYIKQTHLDYRGFVRAFVEREIMPSMDQWKEKSEPPRGLYKKMGQAGLLAAMVGPPWPSDCLPSHVNATKPKDYDYFHSTIPYAIFTILTVYLAMIVFDEISRTGHSGVIAALTNGPSIALSPVLSFAQSDLRLRIARETLLGEEFIALAISEPQAGSDVAGLVTIATKTSSGGYRLNGNKKWITNGAYAKYHVTACCTTPGAARKGLSLLVVERGMPGFSTRKIRIRGVDVTGTAYLDFLNCEVPAINLLGKENDGFRLTMHNFNKERLYIIACACRLSRVCLEESIKYAMKRKTFGKRLEEHQVVRMKIAAMTRRVECLQSWMESVTYQMCTMSHSKANMEAGDVISLVKVEASKVYEYCARETTQIFGGNSMFMDGVGAKIEPAVSQVKGYQIPAGAEDIMDDFGARSAFQRAHANL